MLPRSPLVRARKILPGRRERGPSPVYSGRHLPDVDVAVIAESTYPYLRGGVSAVIHDIVMTNPDIEFGIIHITWDTDSAHTELYEPPPNVKWVHPIYLSMREHVDDFIQVDAGELGGGGARRIEIAEQLCDAVADVFEGRTERFFELYDSGINPVTRTFNLWPILGTEEFMRVARVRLQSLELSFSDMFWLLREFFSLTCAVAGAVYPRAKVYHAHTTGYAALMGALAARQHGTKFLLTEHNLYVRDTINQLLERSMALPIRVNDWREFDGITPVERAWMAWWIELTRVAYDRADLLTYLYPSALGEAADLGSPIERSVVVPNGMVVASFEEPYRARMAALPTIDEPGKVWRLAYIARIVPIKGLLDLIDAVNALQRRGVRNVHIDVLGPNDERPDYEEACKRKIAELDLKSWITFRGSVKVKDHLGGYDALVLPSHNEGQPMVVLEAMSAGLPVVGTTVGGMSQLVTETLYKDGQEYGPCGLLVPPHDVQGMADIIQALTADPERYRQWATSARARAEGFFQLHDAMREYNDLYRELGRLPLRLDLREVDLAAQEAREASAPPSHASTPPAVIELPDTADRHPG